METTVPQYVLVERLHACIKTKYVVCNAHIYTVNVR